MLIPNANILELYYADYPGSMIYKMDVSKLINKDDCSLSNSEANELTQLVGTLSRQTVAITSEECAIFFSNVLEKSVLCADTSKEINFNNMVRYIHSLWIR